MIESLVLWGFLTGHITPFPEYKNDPVERMQTLMYEKDGSGPIMPPDDSWLSEYRRQMNELPSHLTPDRTHGSVR